MLVCVKVEFCFFVFFLNLISSALINGKKCVYIVVLALPLKALH